MIASIAVVILELPFPPPRRKDEEDIIELPKTFANIYPTRSPRNPPIDPIINVSDKKIFNTELFLIPKAFNNPISRVRSDTDIYIVFIIPIPAISSEIEAIDPKNEKIEAIDACMVSIIEFAERSVIVSDE